MINALTCTYEGSFLFSRELVARELVLINDAIYENFVEGDCEDPTLIQLNEKFSGLEWNGEIENGDLAFQINYVLAKMKQILPELKIQGRMLGIDTRTHKKWIFDLNNDGYVFAEELPEKYQNSVICPHCHQSFSIDD